MEKLRDFYSHVTVKGTLKHTLPQQGKSLEQKFVYRAAGPQVRLDVTTTANKGMGAKVGGSDMYMATSYGSLTSIRNPGSPSFDDARQLNYGDTKAAHREHVPAELRLYVRRPQDDPRLSAAAQRPRREDHENQARGRIARQGHLSRNLGQRTCRNRPQAWFVLSPSEGWAVREYSRTYRRRRQRGHVSWVLELRRTKDGVPAGQADREPRKSRSEPHRVAREVVLISKFIAGDPDNQYFTAFDF